MLFDSGNGRENAIQSATYRSAMLQSRLGEIFMALEKMAVEEHSLDIDAQPVSEEALRSTPSTSRRRGRIVTQDTPAGNGPKPALIHTTPRGKVYCGDSLRLLRSRTKIAPGSVNLIMTSPPFGLVRKK